MSEKVINVGFDFGTSTTKVCLHDLSFGEHYFFCFDKSKNDLYRYCIPSILSICDGKVYFGESRNPNAEYKLLKMRIRSDQDFDLSPYTKTKLKAYQLISIYCAGLLSEINKMIQKNYKNAKIIYQFGIPIDHFNSEPEKERRFILAFRMAEYLSRNAELFNNKTDINWFLDRIKNAENEVLNKDEGEQVVVIYPETIAGVAALFKNNKLTILKRYSIVDIGAGTTDISFFEFTNFKDFQGRFHVYVSKTLDCGVENKIPDKDSIEEIRKTFEKGFKNARDKSKEKWSHDFYLLRLGGGNKTDLKDFSLAANLSYRENHLNLIELKTIDIDKFPIPSSVGEFGNAKENKWMDYFDLLAISYGLSTPNQSMPTYNPQVPPPLRITREREHYEPLTPDVG